MLNLGTSLYVQLSFSTFLLLNIQADPQLPMPSHSTPWLCSCFYASTSKGCTYLHGMASLLDILFLQIFKLSDRISEKGQSHSLGTNILLLITIINQLCINSLRVLLFKLTGLHITIIMEDLVCDAIIFLNCPQSVHEKY